MLKFTWLWKAFGSKNIREPMIRNPGYERTRCDSRRLQSARPGDFLNGHSFSNNDVSHHAECDLFKDSAESLSPSQGAILLISSLASRSFHVEKFIVNGPLPVNSQQGQCVQKCHAKIVITDTGYSGITCYID